MAPKKVLLAEDDADDQQLFHHFLQHRSDISLLPAAENGEALLHFLAANTLKEDLPGLIVLDQNMPKRSGLQTLEALKKDDRYKHIPVVVYSTYTDPQLIQNATALGASAVVPKPVTGEGYNQMIDEFLSIFNDGSAQR